MRKVSTIAVVVFAVLALAGPSQAKVIVIHSPHHPAPSRVGNGSRPAVTVTPSLAGHHIVQNPRVSASTALAKPATPASSDDGGLGVALAILAGVIAMGVLVAAVRRLRPQTHVRRA